MLKTREVGGNVHVRTNNKTKTKSKKFCRDLCVHHILYVEHRRNVCKDENDPAPTMQGSSLPVPN